MQRAVRLVTPERPCPDCGHAMASANKGRLCWACTEKEAEAALEAAQEVQAHKRAYHKRAGKPPREEGLMEVMGVKLKPAEHPPGLGGARNERWPAVIAEFLRSGEECCELECSDIRAKGIYASLHKHLRSSREAFPMVRGDKCYLVRIKKWAEL